MSPPRIDRLVLTLAIALAGCGGEPTPATDAGSDAGPDRLGSDGAIPDPVEPTPPAPPQIAALPPSLEPRMCPDGWSLVAGACDPWPDGVLPACAAGEAAFVGAGCRRIGSECPADGWPAELPAGLRVVHVRAGADPALADGSREAPYATITDGMANANATDVVAIAVGTYDEVLRIDRSITLHGACASGTVLAPTRSLSARPVHVIVPWVELRELTVRAPSHRGAIVMEPGTSLDVRDVHVAAAVAHGIVAAGRLTGARIIIEEIAPDPTGGYAEGLAVPDGGSAELSELVARGRMRTAVQVWGTGRATLTDTSVHRIDPHLTEPWNVAVFVGGGGTLTLRRGTVEQIGWTAIGARDGSTVTLEDVVVRDTLQSPDGLGGEGLLSHLEAHIDGTRVLVERNRAAGVTLYEAGHIALTDSVIRENRPGQDGWGGFGASVRGGSTLTLERVLLDANRGAGAYVDQAGSQLVMRDSVVRGTRARPGVGDGVGVHAVADAVATLERCELVDNRNVGVLVDSRVELADVTIRGTLPARGIEGNGIHVGGIGRLSGARVLLEENHGNGLKLWNGGAAVLTDLVVRDTAPGPTGAGVGVWATEGGCLEVTRALFERNSAAAVAVEGAERGNPGNFASAIVRDVVVRDTRSDALLGFFGNAFRVASGSLELERALLEDNREAAISVQNAVASARLTDVVIRRTGPRECASREIDPCPSSIAAGCGVAAFNAARVEMTRFVISEGALCGVMVAQGGVIELHEGEVSSNPIGANVQVIDYDLSLLSDRVRYFDNQRNYDGARLPVPDEGAPLTP